MNLGKEGRVDWKQGNSEGSGKIPWETMERSQEEMGLRHVTREE